MALSVPERIAQIAEHFASHQAHGYSQPNRGTGGTETITLSDGSRVSITASDVDCSEMVRQCVNGALGRVAIPYMWTGNEDELLRGVGFKVGTYGVNAATRGTILWRKGHTGVALGGNRQAEAYADERGGITGPSRGDQTGGEVRVAPLASDWTHVYQWPAPAQPSRPRQVPGDPKNNNGVWYRSHVEGVGWLDAVHDGQVAGTTGYAARMEALKLQLPAGVVADVIAHVQDVGSLAYEDVRSTVGRSGTASTDGDPVIGTTGRALRMEALTVHPKANPTGRRLFYQVHMSGIGWGPVCEAGQRAGTKGEGRAIEAVRIWME